jgi:SSS family solute:Na+ symporter
VKVSLGWMAALLSLYVAIVVGVGLAARRRASSSPEEYFLAGRGLGTAVLFMALFGTNATAFVLVGIPGRAYHDGIGTFGLNAPIIALGIPLSFWAIGSPARRMALRLGAMTPAELYAKRFDARSVGFVLFAFFTLYTVPYMVTAVKGAALTLAAVSQGTIPEWVGGLGVIVVALVYTTLGGMRATAWTNVIQGSVFLLFMVIAFVLMASSLGGIEAAMQRVATHDADLLRLTPTGLFAPRAWASWGIAIALTVIAFPHMLVRLMAGSSERALRGVCRLYPVALLLLWIPAVMIGVWGAAAFPGLEGRASDKIFSLMSSHHLPPALGACGFLAVLAAVMSTLDAQILTLGSMLTRDVLDPLTGSKEPRGDVRSGRIFGVVVALLVYGLALAWGASVFDIAKLAFSGYVTLTPMMLLGVRWRRLTTSGAIASIVVGNMLLAAGMAGAMPTFGFLPVFWAWIGGFAAAIVVSLAGARPDPATLRRAFG